MSDEQKKTAIGLDQKVYNMKGYKLFKEEGDHIHMIRIVHFRKPYKIKDSTKSPAEITIYDYDTDERKKVRVDSLSEYHPLKPDGIFTVTIANLLNSKNKIVKDIIVTGTKYLNMEVGMTMPYAVCRQNITDIFYNLMCQDADDTMVGLALNQDTCPSNFDFGLMFAANSIENNSEYINFYRTDTLDDILDMMDTSRFDRVLSDLYNTHCETVDNPAAYMKDHDAGWCRDLRTLLSNNCFQEDLNQMLGITNLGFIIAPYLEERDLPNGDGKYLVACDAFRYWLSSIFKVNISEITFLEFDHDINLGDFNDATYFLFRDTTNKLYLAVYTSDGEYYEADLLAKAKEYDFSTKFKIDFYNKYNANNK